MKTMIITLSSTDHNITHELTLDFIQNGMGDKWIERLECAKRNNYPISEDNQFYFLNNEWDKEACIDQINSTVDEINIHSPGLINLWMDDTLNQDTLNYLHHKFEVYHGVLEAWREPGHFLNDKPTELRTLLHRLNILVHRTEHTKKKAEPRIRVPWYDLPKDKVLADEDYDLFTCNFEFGTAYFSQCDVGKTIEDLMIDDDAHVEVGGVCQMDHYSTDFDIKFYNTDNADQHLKDVHEFFYTNQSLFAKCGHHTLTNKVTIGKIPFAKLRYTSEDEVLKIVKNFNRVLDVTVR